VTGYLDGYERLRLLLVVTTSHGTVEPNHLDHHEAFLLEVVIELAQAHTPTGDAARGRRLAVQALALERSNPGDAGGAVVGGRAWVKRGANAEVEMRIAE
jgi:hypothetical protein